MTIDQKRLMRVNATSARLPTTPSQARSALLGHSGRIIGSGDRPLILLRQGAGIQIDFVVSREGDVLHLASGAIRTSQMLIAETAASVPRAMPYWSGPGIGLWDAFARMLRPEIWKQINENPGRVLTREHCRQLSESVFRAASNGEALIVARPLPIEAHLGFVHIDPSLYGFYEWDPITEQAYPATGSGAQPYGTIRVVSPEEWRAMHVEAAAATNAAAAKSGRGTTAGLLNSDRKSPGPKKDKREKVKMAMDDDIRSGKFTLAGLRAMKVLALGSEYKVNRQTALAALGEIVANSNTDK